MNVKEAAVRLEEIARLLELKGENPFKVRAYTGAARTLRATKLDLPEFVEQAGAGKIRGIGKAISGKLETLLQTGSLPYLDELRAAFPESVRELLLIPGLGAAKVRALIEDLGVHSLGELEYACIENRLVALKGFGNKLQSKVLAGIRARRRYQNRFRLPEALEAADGALALLKSVGNGDARFETAGELRRFLETVNGLDVLATGASTSKVTEHLESRKDIGPVRHTPDGATFRFAGIPVRLHFADRARAGAALVLCTGSKAHVEGLRRRAQTRGLRLGPDGLIRDDTPVETPNEAEVYTALGLPPIPPELREGRGEIEAAEHGRRFDNLVQRKDLLGVLHLHTTWSDGAGSLAEMAATAQRAGMKYLGVTDHSRNAFYAHGLQPDDVLRQHEEIDALNRELAPFRIFKGIESDILPDGSLDYDDELLARFDFVIASVHSSFGQPADRMTERILRAVRNRFTTILGHPTGRLLLAREPYAVDMKRVLEAAAETGTAIELNANPHRLDLDWRLLARARELGVPVPICPDAHSPNGLGDVFFGVKTARKGGLTPADVLNCLPTDEVAAFFRRKRR
ncbi:MAG: DNA polymerase/3'-5' exonuclease PolX [Kiritimatiellaeota bacterium]|nr:DNA polymerase/3'-5' exonuclease PolX [Kiritimatiellota bacterium]